MRVGASRPRQTSQSDDKDKNVTNDGILGDKLTADGKEGISNDDQDDFYDETESR